MMGGPGGGGGAHGGPPPPNLGERKMNIWGGGGGGFQHITAGVLCKTTGGTVTLNILPTMTIFFRFL